MNDKFEQIFDNYKSSSVDNVNYLTFWDSRTKEFTNDYVKNNPLNQTLTESIFTLYNQKDDIVSGWLHTHPDVFTITTKTLEDARTKIFSVCNKLGYS